MTIKSKDGTLFSIWILEVGQSCACSPARCHEFTAVKTASIVYDVKSIHGHNCTEYPIGDSSIWQWVQKFMQLGFDSKK